MKRSFYFVKYFLLLAVTIVTTTVFLILLDLDNSKFASAQLVNFASTKCEGGWAKVENASGKPTVDNGGYTEQNSAVYLDNASEIKCYGFEGVLPPQTYHTRVFLRFSWEQIRTDSNRNNDKSQVDEEVPKENEEVTSGFEVSNDNQESVSESTDTSANTDTSTDVDTLEDLTPSSEPETLPEEAVDKELPDEIQVSESGDNVPEEIEDVKPAEAIAPTEEPATPTDEVSWWKWFGGVAFAQEDVLVGGVSADVSGNDEMVSSSIILEDIPNDILPLSDVEDSEIPINDSASSTSVEDDYSSASTSDTPLPNPIQSQLTSQFAVYVQLADSGWRLLGEVVTINNDIRFEIPKDLIATVEDISLIQIKLVPLTQFDLVPPVYLDAMWLEVSYAPVGDLGVHSVSQILPEVYKLSDIISESGTSSVIVASSTMPIFASKTDFAQAIEYMHGVDARHLLVGIKTHSETRELWLIDNTTLLVSRIGFGEAVFGDMSPVMKDGLIFWLNTSKNKIYTFDMRTSGILNEMMLVANLPDTEEYRLEFPFTDWQVIWRGSNLYFFSAATGELFTDENTKSVEYFANMLNLGQYLSEERLGILGIQISTTAESDTVTE